VNWVEGLVDELNGSCPELIISLRVHHEFHASA
jgi:hypothetical protein